MRPFPFINPTLYTVLISKLLMKTRACLSRVSSGLIVSSCSEKALFLSWPPFCHMGEKKDSVLTSVYTHVCLECMTSFTAGQTLIYRSTTEHYWMMYCRGTMARQVLGVIFIQNWPRSFSVAGGQFICHLSGTASQEFIPNSRCSYLKEIFKLISLCSLQSWHMKSFSSQRGNRAKELLWKQAFN